ncbi:hypothetical protein ACFQDI_07520 [Prosthecobacter fluviatilis]|uniref:Uncharacterized protein n=2 Tax=Prosthecobacter fluviatilis TaxID=445931 RepID=A0ABW0KMW6_9BACT
MMRLLLLLLVSQLCTAAALADTRVFVSLVGTLLEAEITAVSGDSVTLKRASDQQSLVVSRRTLCKEDGAYIARWAAQHAEQPPATAPATAGTSAPAQKFRLFCQILPARNNRSSGDTDQRVFECTYSFSLSNQEVTRDLRGARGLALILGKNAAESNGDLIVLQKEEFDISIPAKSKMVHITQPVRLTYNVGVNAPIAGVKSYGYVLIIRDAAGALLHVEANPDTSARYIREILSITEVPCMVDREFRPNPRAELPLGYISF